MKINVDVPPDIERALLRKCEELGLSPGEFVNQLLEWYFFKRKRDIPKELVEFYNYARKKGIEKARKCKYSDEKYCALETYKKLDITAEPKPIHPYDCLFCSYFADSEYEERSKMKITSDDAERIYQIAKLSAKIVVREYGEKLGYRPKMKIEKEEREIGRDEIKKLVENW